MAERRRRRRTEPAGSEQTAVPETSPSGGASPTGDTSPSGDTSGTGDTSASGDAFPSADAAEPLTMATGESEVTTIPRHEEALTAEKTLEEIGALYITKDVSEARQSLDVPVRSERVNVTRRSTERRVDGPVTVYEEGDTLVIPVVEERLEIRKVAYVVEELLIDRVLREETRTISDTIRKEHVTIEQHGQLRAEQQPSAAGGRNDG